MEIINNFCSIYCFVAFVIGAGFMLTVLSTAAISKVKKPRNNVYFYVARDENGELWLYMGKPIRVVTAFFACSHGLTLIQSRLFSRYGLNKDNYDNLKWEDEPVEVFLNMED